MEERPKALSVSVVLGTYNGEKYLARQLESLLRQTAPPFEIVVGDDRSSDRTVEIVRSFARATEVPIRLTVNAQNLGFGENFLQAAERAHGDLIAFCDQDDVWSPQKLEVCAAAFEADTVLAVHTARLVNQDEEVVGRFSQDIDGDAVKGPLAYDPWGVFFGFSMVFRRSLLSAVPSERRPLDYITGGAKLAHDRWVLYLANMMGATREIAAPLVDYRQHGANAFGAFPELSLREHAARTLGDSSRYVQATQELRALVGLIDPGARRTFPSFDPAAADRFWRAAERHQLSRARVYRAGSRLAGAAWLLRNLVTGVYASVHSRRFRPRAVMKDLVYLMLSPADNRRAARSERRQVP